MTPLKTQDNMMNAIKLMKPGKNMEFEADVQSVLKVVVGCIHYILTVILPYQISPDLPRRLFQ